MAKIAGFVTPPEIPGKPYWTRREYDHWRQTGELPKQPNARRSKYHPEPE